MNTQRKNSAVKKFTAEKESGKSKDEVLELINSDEKQYSSDEAVEILVSVFSEDEKDNGQEKNKSKNPAKGVVYFVEWDVKIDKGVATKLKVSRPVVKISQEEADTLNHGIEKGGNTYGKMYYLPE